MEGEKFWEAQRSKGMPVWKRSRIKLEAERGEFENYFAEILLIFSCMKI